MEPILEVMEGVIKANFCKIVNIYGMQLCIMAGKVQWRTYLLKDVFFIVTGDYDKPYDRKPKEVMPYT